MTLYRGKSYSKIFLQESRKIWTNNALKLEIVRQYLALKAKITTKIDEKLEILSAK